MRGAELETAAESARRDDVVQLGVWVFLGTVLMLFAAFTSAYIVRRSGSDWRSIELPGLLWANTAVLIAASLALEAGRMAASRGKEAPARRGVSAAIGLGMLFLAGQLAVWREMVARGVYLPTSPHSAFVYILTGLHGLHILAGLVLLVYARTRFRTDPEPLADSGSSRAAEGSRTGARAAARPELGRVMTASATFWHFLVGLWLYVIALVTVF